MDESRRERVKEWRARRWKGRAAARRQWRESHQSRGVSRVSESESAIKRQRRRKEEVLGERRWKWCNQGEIVCGTTGVSLHARRRAPSFTGPSGAVFTAPSSRASSLQYYHIPAWLSVTMTTTALASACRHQGQDWAEYRSESWRRGLNVEGQKQNRDHSDRLLINQWKIKIREVEGERPWRRYDK